MHSTYAKTRKKEIRLRNVAKSYTYGGDGSILRRGDGDSILRHMDGGDTLGGQRRRTNLVSRKPSSRRRIDLVGRGLACTGGEWKAHARNRLERESREREIFVPSE
ncbi:unnamed protein product [Linum trigynum]|uniref:Uncharacterized protein n=1 Tax=Linum trigynum TaxID=586398 RepID=A0AAV2F9Y8_9ROSI